MWRALAAFVVVLLAAGVYTLATADPSGAASATSPGNVASRDFGFALAAGAIALAATLLIAKPRLRMRR